MIAVLVVFALAPGSGSSPSTLSGSAAPPAYAGAAVPGWQAARERSVTWEDRPRERDHRRHRADGAGATGRARPAAGSSLAGVPARLLVPTLGVDAPVVPLSVSEGVLIPPSDPQSLGWWSGGAEAGAVRGSVLITGHTVHTGGGAFDDLERLRSGDLAVVRTPAGGVRYRVHTTRTYAKASLAEHAGALFSQRVPGRLVLVTCEDWDGSHYLSNVVVVADPA